jgi:hypothetical protein
MQESIPKGKPPKNSPISLQVSTHIFVWLNENHLVGRAKYLMTFTDDNTIMLWAYFLKQKLEPLVVFKEFQAMVEINSKRNIKAI